MTEAEVTALVRALEAQWNTGDMAGMAALWDADHPDPVYQAEEEDALARGWPALRDYWTRTQALNARVAVRYDDIGVTTLGADMALAHWRMHWDIALSGQARPIGGDNRIFAIARRTAQGWRFVAYIEAPLAPLTYIRRLYETQVTKGF